MIKLNNAGDSIVEVLISMSILAFALGTAYATVNRSNQSIMANKERYQAQLLANQQIEYLRAYAQKGGDRASLNSVHTCLKLNSAMTTGFDVKNNASPNTTDCDFHEVYGATYKINTAYIGGPGSCNDTIYCNYKISVSWDSIKGGTETLALWYGL